MVILTYHQMQLCLRQKLSPQDKTREAMKAAPAKKPLIRIAVVENDPSAVRRLPGPVRLGAGFRTDFRFIA